MKYIQVSETQFLFNFSLLIDTQKKPFFDNGPHFEHLDDDSMWNELLKTKETQLVDSSPVAKKLYDDYEFACDEENRTQQEMADMDWEYAQAEREMWREGARELLKNMAKEGIKPLAVF